MLERSRQDDGHAREQTGPAPTAAPGRGLSPASLLALQRTAGNRATQQYLQRMTVAIDGDTDKRGVQAGDPRLPLEPALQEERSRVRVGGARGKVAGPAVRSKLSLHMRPLLASDSETIYVLAHGSRYPASIGDMSPTEMAQWLRAPLQQRRRLGPRMAGSHVGPEDAVHLQHQLVSCHSAADSRHRLATDKATIYPFNRSYAEALARALAPTSPTDPFRPSRSRASTGSAGSTTSPGASPPSTRASTTPRR